MIQVVCWLAIFKTFSVKADGIILPVTSVAYKTSPEQRPLSLTFTPNTCEIPAPYTSQGTRTFEPITSHIKLPPESCIVQNSQPHSGNLENASFKTVSASAAPSFSIHPKLQTIERPSQIQLSCPNVAFAPQTLALPQIDSSYLENSNYINIGRGMDDCKQKPVPPVLHYQPNYLIANTDDGGNKYKVPLVPVTLDKLPSNIQKLKIADSKPIFIDCSKMSNAYQIPPALTPVNPFIIKNIEKPNPLPNIELFQTPITEKQLIQDKSVICESSSVLIENSVMPPNANNCFKKQQILNKAVDFEEKEKAINTETPSSNGKVVYPISNVKFDYGPNAFSRLQKSTAKTQSCSAIPPKITPIDLKTGVEVTPIVNIAANTPHLPLYNIESCDNKINIAANPEPEPRPLSSPCICNEAYIAERKIPVVPVSKLPNVNPTNIPPPRPFTTPHPTTTSGTSTFTSQLSSSLNNIISLLTENLLSNMLGKTPDISIPVPTSNEIACGCVEHQPICFPTTVVKDTLILNPSLDCSDITEPVIDIPETIIKIDTLHSCPSLDCINLYEPILDTPNTIINTDNLVSNPFDTCPVPIIPPVILPCPEISLKQLNFGECLTNPCASCTHRAPKCKPYIASITINIIPSPEPSSDIIIVI